MTDAKALVALVRELSEKATEGPWESTHGQVCNWRMVVAQFVAKSTEDAALCATYRTAAPQLADMLEAESERADTAERRLEIAMRAIEEAPHAVGCHLFPHYKTPGELSPGTTCTCWKSRVAAQLNTP